MLWLLKVWAELFYILRKHLAPNFIASIMFMIVMNISHAIVAESTLSFLGLGLPTDIISWGSLLSLAPNALLTKEWWWNESKYQDYSSS